jgi:tetratricopeptide (TPR) repeat protein
MPYDVDRTGGGRSGPVSETWRADLARGLKSLAAGQFDRAETYFSRAYRLAPDQPEVCFALGRERLRRGRYVDAERLLRAAWENDPTLYTAAASLARCLAVGLERVDEAHSVVEKAMALYPDEPGLHVVQGEIFLEQEFAGPARQAFEEARRLLEATGRDAAATRHAVANGLARCYNLDGVTLGREGRSDEALFSFKRAADLDPEWAGPIVNMGVAFAQLGRGARARSCYERALAKEPDNLLARFQLAHLARDAGDLTRAEDGYRAILRNDSEYPGARVALAEVLFERGDGEAALALLRIELERGSEDPNVHFQTALCYERHDRLGLAEKFLRVTIELDPDHVPACCRLASLLARDGRYLEAAALARRAQEIDPERAKRYLGRLETE